MKGSPTKSKLPVRVFLVDDHPTVRQGLSLLINLDPDLTVCGEAENERESLAQIAAVGPDVVILDLSLKQGSGLEVIRRLQTLSPRIRILVFSMHHEAYYVRSALRAGAHGYVVKDEGAQTVVQALRRVCQGGTYLSSLASAPGAGSGDLPAGSGPFQHIHRLSDRELEVLTLIGQGLSIRAVARHLGLSLRQAESSRAQVKKKLELKFTPDLTHFAFNWVNANPSSPQDL